MFHFITGYTAKVAGTEIGVTEPTATFSACFGDAFIPLHPTFYAEMLSKKMAEHGAQGWLVNTGWSGGKFGVGSVSFFYFSYVLENSIEILKENP